MVTSSQRPYRNQKLLGEFIVAAVQNHDKACYLLKLHPELLDARSTIGETPLHYLIIENCIEGVQFLLARGANPNLPDNFGTTPLHNACRLGHAGIITILRNHHAVALEYGKSPVTPEELEQHCEMPTQNVKDGKLTQH